MTDAGPKIEWYDAKRDLLILKRTGFITIDKTQAGTVKQIRGFLSAISVVRENIAEKKV